MRALFYSGEEHWSGAARATFHASRALAARGHEVLVACCAGSALEQSCTAWGTETVVVGGRAPGLGGTRDLRRVLLDREVDVTVVNTERDQLVVSSAVRFARRGAVLRRVQPFHEVVVGRAGRLALKLAPAALVVSSQRESEAVPSGGWRLPPFVVPPGIASDASTSVSPAPRRELGISGDGDALLIVCPYVPAARARLATLFRALGLIAPRHPSLRALVIGRGAEDETLRMHASALGVSRLVHFLGERLDMRPVVAAADLGWVIADGDAGALDYLTFMEFGTPIVAERSPLAQQFVIDGVTGLLLPPAEPAYHASSVAAFLPKADLRRAMGQAGRGKAQREFSWSEMTQALERAVAAAAEVGLTRS